MELKTIPKKTKNPFFLRLINSEILLNANSNIVKYKFSKILRQVLFDLQPTYKIFQRKGRLLSFLWELGTIVGYTIIYYFRNSFDLVPYNYLMALVGLISVLLLWFYCFCYDLKHHRGITYYFYKHIFSVNIDDTKLIEKIKSSQQTSVTLVTAGYTFIGIMIAVGSVNMNITNNFSYITNFILITTIIFTLICIILFEIRIDALDMATYPNMPKFDRIILWKRAGLYYLIGYISFVYAVLLGISLINPFLTVIGTTIYIFVFINYYYIFDKYI